MIHIRQFTILALLFIGGTSVFELPSRVATIAKQDAWLAILLSIGWGMMVIPLYSMLGKRYPNQSVVEYCETIIGKYVGKVMALFFIWGFVFLLAVMTLRNSIDFISAQIMVETPHIAIYFLFMAVIVLGVYYGLEVIARTAELFFPWIVLFCVCFIFFTLPQIDWRKLQPICEHGFTSVIRGSLVPFSFPFLDIVIFLMIIPYTKQKNKISAALLYGWLICGLFLMVVTLLSILVVGADQTARSVYSSYIVAQKLSMSEFLERLEVVMALIWFLMTYFRMAILIYVMATGLAKIFRLEGYRFLIMPVALLVIFSAESFIPNTLYTMILFPYWGTYALFPGIVLPLFLLLLDSYRKHKQISNGKAEQQA